MGNDVRTRLTKKLIKETFMELLKEKPVRSVTVKEICEIAEINRSTFYKHFLDVYDVLEQIQDDIVEMILVKMDEYPGRELLLLILREIKEHSRDYTDILQSFGNTDFIYRITEACYKKLCDKPHESGDTAYEFLCSPEGYAFFAGGIGGVVSWWMGSGMKESPEEIADSIERCSNSLWARS